MNILETSIERMGDLAAESSRMLDELEKINTSTAQTIDIVTDQTDRTNQSAEKINEAVVAIAEENAASTQETSASMNTLTENIDRCKDETEILSTLSTELNEQTSKFKL